MIISREADYALRILRILSDGKRHHMENMCKTEYIPQQFAYKILEKMQKGNLVRGVRGKNGGCELTADLHEVTLYDLLRMIDNDCYLNLCLTPGYECAWAQNHPEACRIHRKLAGLQTQLDEAFRKLDLYSVIFE